MRLVLSNRYCERKHWRWVSNLNWCRYCEAEDAWANASTKILALSDVVREARMGEELIAELKWSDFRSLSNS